MFHSWSFYERFHRDGIVIRVAASYRAWCTQTDENMVESWEKHFLSALPSFVINNIFILNIKSFTRKLHNVRMLNRYLSTMENQQLYRVKYFWNILSANLGNIFANFKKWLCAI